MSIRFNYCKMLRKHHALQWLMFVIALFAVFQIFTTLRQEPIVEKADTKLTGRVPKAFHAAEDTEMSKSFSEDWPNVTYLQMEIEQYLAQTKEFDFKFPWNFQLRDNRDKSCIVQYSNYSAIPANSVSIIMAIGNAPLTQVLSSVMYVLFNTPKSLVQNIFVVGDTRISESDFEILENVLIPVPFFRTFRLNNITSDLAAAYFASKFTKAPYLVMMNARVIVSSAWLEPLVFQLKQHFRNVVVPSVIFKLNETQNESDWSFSLRRELDFDLDLHWGHKVLNRNKVTRTPTVYEHLFLVSAKFFKEIGGFDSVRGAAGAEAVLWSIKTYLCRGQVIISPCSRVYESPLINNSNKRLDITKITNYKMYIARAFMGTDQASYMCLAPVFNRGSAARGGGIRRSRSSSTIYFSNRARNFYQQSLKCSSFRTFLTIAQPGLVIRPKATEYFGKLKAKSLDLYLSTDRKREKIVLVGNDTQMGREFRFDASHFMFGNKCIDVKNNELVLTYCGNLPNTNLWTYQYNRLMYKNRKCLTHQPDSKGNTKGTLKMMPCTNNYTKQNQFVFSLQYAKSCL
ncbi:hypothetical protein LOTGIDRAFT_235690 [Lottia gigantea]|uniref:Uncharacterized protein n=1 Tax=Lottia gigantea TaxID=225164 RepID=V3Z5B7_LOTGI|nr:hypothetical protein LOTGIDRAFT_235690 [Lottia gigantea]ESO85918.1 hypothetical protein LOTGIDRAFT_235690 [Lottia gigantea]